MHTVAEARHQVLEKTPVLAANVEPLTSSVRDRVLAEDVACDLDSPPFDKAMMDGYAVRSADCASPAKLTVIETIAAGMSPTNLISAGQAAKIMTGAPIPIGADSVVKIESTRMLENDRVQIDVPVPANVHILRRGDEMRNGEIVLPKGSILRPQQFGLLASVGRTSAQVYASPKVTIISTGDELVEANATPTGGQIRNSNGPMLVAQTVRAGGIPRYLGIALDQESRMRTLIQEGLYADVLILSGGVSMGSFDLVPKVLDELGVETHFHKVAMKPGKPLLFGTKEKKLIFGLPGNPVSSFVGFELFVRPALEKMLGHSSPGPVVSHLPLAIDFKHSSDRETYYPATLERTESGDKVRPAKWFGSADLRGLTRADVLAVLPVGEHRMEAGQLIPVIILERG